MLPGISDEASTTMAPGSIVTVRCDPTDMRQGGHRLALRTLSPQTCWEGGSSPMPFEVHDDTLGDRQALLPRCACCAHAHEGHATPVVGSGVDDLLDTARGGEGCDDDLARPAEHLIATGPISRSGDKSGHQRARGSPL